jgi:hypothetical protein
MSLFVAKGRQVWWLPRAQNEAGVTATLDSYSSVLNTVLASPRLQVNHLPMQPELNAPKPSPAHRRDRF